jgi:hypothetical protein
LTPTSSQPIELLINPVITDEGEYISVGDNQYLIFVQSEQTQLINPVIIGNDEYLEVGNDEYLVFVDPN